jgi:hypothetical protein
MNTLASWSRVLVPNLTVGLLRRVLAACGGHGAARGSRLRFTAGLCPMRDAACRQQTHKHIYMGSKVAVRTDAAGSCLAPMLPGTL